MITRIRRHGRVALVAAVAVALCGSLAVRELVVDRAGSEPATWEGAATTDRDAAFGDDRRAPTADSRFPDGLGRCWGQDGADGCGSTTTPPETDTAPATGGPAAAQPGVAGPVAPGGFPNAASTGVPAGWQPAAVHQGDLWVRTPGTVIENMHVTGSIEVRANDVTIRNTKVDGTIWNQESSTQYRGLLIEDSEVGPDSGVSDWSNGAIGTSGYTARRVEIHGFTDGFRVSGGGVRIEDSFVRVAEMPGGCPHLDGVQGYGGGQNVVVRHNTIDGRGSCSTSAVFMADGSHHIDLQDNLLLGGAYSIHLNQREVPSTFVVTGNRVVEGSYDYGPAQFSDGGALTLSCGGNRLVTIDGNYQVTADRGEIAC